jgi:molybdopterin/thiamine biosynthesis adenylyltransferase
MDPRRYAALHWFSAHPRYDLSMNSAQLQKYSRQILFPGIGEAGQEKLLHSSAVIVGCGALGSAVATLLVRAGVGRVRFLDRDFVEPSNLQRQSLFNESDASEGLPKAVAAARHLGEMNSDVVIEPYVTDLIPANAAELLDGFDLILDGVDNFETRLLVNDYAISSSVPWIYAAVLGSYGLTMTILPNQTACLACLREGGQAAATPAEEATCDTVGVLNAAVGVVASLETAEALKILSGHPEALHHRLLSFDVWTGRSQSLLIPRCGDCRACVHRQFRWLEGHDQPHITMCGRNSVQIHERRRQLDLAVLAQRLRGIVQDVRQNAFLLRFRVPPCELTVFPDGRTIVSGTQDPTVARSLYARFLGA